MGAKRKRSDDFGFRGLSSSSPSNQVRPPFSGAREVGEKESEARQKNPDGAEFARGEGGEKRRRVVLWPHVTSACGRKLARLVRIPAVQQSWGVGGHGRACAMVSSSSSPPSVSSLHVREHARTHAQGLRVLCIWDTDTCAPLPPCWFPGGAGGVKWEFSRGQSPSRGSWPEAGWRRCAESDG